MDVLALPSLNKHVTDYSGVLSSEQAELLSAKFADHENKTTEQVLTVLIPHRQGHELLDIGLKLFNENGIGQKELNNGLLLIISTEEKKLRIITGKGMEIKYSEMVCREIVEKKLRPLLNAGKYEEMILKWHETLNTLEEDNIKKSIFFPDPEKDVIFEIPKNSRAEGVAILSSLVVIILLAIFFVRSCSQADWSTPGGTYYPSSSSSSDYSSSSDSSSSSSYDGGGGSSNGGGYGD